MSRHRKLTRKFAGFPMFKLASSGETFPVTSPFTTGFTGLDNDQLALDLQFATDKTLTARKGPTPVLTRGSTGTFVGSDGLIQSAATNTPRFDHDPVTGVCKGLLIEEQRTNIVLQSENLGTTWVLNNSSATLNAIVAPDGLTTADQLNENTATAVHQAVQSVGTLTAAQPYTFFVFAKAALDSSFQVSFSTTAFGSALFANFILAGSGSVGTSSGLVTRIESYPDGWYRCIVTINSVTGGANGFVQINANNNNSNAVIRPSYLGTGTSTVYLWGAQLELGAFPTSYIPTTTGTVIRSADVCSISGSDFSGFWNLLEGSLSTSAIFNAPVTHTTTQFLVDVNDGTTANRLRYYRLLTTGRPEFANTSGNSLNAQIIGSTALQPFVTQKYSAGFKLDDYAFYVNNTQIGTDNLGAMIVSPTTMTIGDASAGAARFHTNGTISSIRYYKKRLSNSKLQAITV